MKHFLFSLLLLLLPHIIWTQDIPNNVLQLIILSTDLNDGIHTVNIQNKLFEVCINEKKVKSIKRRVVQDDLCSNLILLLLIIWKKHMLPIYFLLIILNLKTLRLHEETGVL